MNKKKLYPVVRAFEVASPAERRRLGDYYFKRVLEPSDARNLSEIISGLGVSEDAEREIDSPRLTRDRFSSVGSASRSGLRRSLRTSAIHGWRGIVFRKRSVRDLEIAPGDRALVRVDYNVTFVGDTGQISDDSRIVETVPTIEYLLERDCRVVLCSHIGRPYGRRDDRYSLTPVALRLSEIMQRPIALAPDCIGKEAETAISGMSPGHIVMLENLRFHIGEESNDREFARQLASLADFYVNDGFGVAHRSHASTAGVADFLPSVAGFLMESEVSALDGVIHTPEHPYIIVMGGAKVSDKVPVIDRLADIADVFLIGGGMAASFLCAQGNLDYGVGVDVDDVEMARRVLDRTRAAGVELVLPTDVVVAGSFDESAEPVTVCVDSIPRAHMVMDIGPLTVRLYRKRLQTAVQSSGMGPWACSSGSSSLTGHRESPVQSRLLMTPLPSPAADRPRTSYSPWD